MNNIDFSVVVTVRVVTYNSSKYVLETLESIKAQTYPHLALVISDDCSTDDTVEKCKEWVNKNQDRFAYTKIIESPINTGISGNGNRAENACETKWVKGIAGDDLLLPNCIQDNMDYIAKYPDTVYLFSKMVFFGAAEDKNQIVASYYDYDFFNLSQAQQYERLIFQGNCIPSPTCFYNIEKTRMIGICNDERIPMVEDYPKWINALRKGVTLNFMDVETVSYRVRNDSLSNSNRQSVRSYQSSRLFYYYYIHDELVKRNGYEETIQYDVDNQVFIYSRSLFVKGVYFKKLMFSLRKLMYIFINIFKKI